MANSVTIYKGSNIGKGVSINMLAGDLKSVSMWNTITNIIRLANYVFLCYLCTDAIIYKTADGKIYGLKR